MIGAVAESGGGGFLAELVRAFRVAEGEDGRTDFQLLAPLVRAAPRGRRPSAVDAEVDPDVFWRVELFYAAVGAAVERRTGIACTVMVKFHGEGSGRVVLVAGRLAVASRQLHDLRAFGYPSLEALAEAGERLVAEGVELIERFPEVARLGLS